MKNLVLAALLAASTTLTLAQAPATPPIVLSRGLNAIVRTTSAPQPTQKPASLFFCPPGKCLYYAGDFDCSASNFNALFDFDNPGIGISDAEVWVGVKPTKDAVVTGAAGNYITEATGIGINPTPFAIRTGISSGKGGKLVCSTQGNAVAQFYENGFCGYGNFMNYSIGKLAKACHLKAKKVYYIDLTPQYNDSSTTGLLTDIVEKKPPNHKGWPNIWDDSYFNSTSFGVTYEPTWGSNGACAGMGCDAFSMSLTGRE